MADLKGSQTEKNLLLSFAGESQARNRYTYFAGQAKKDGYVQIADIFQETADQEKEHAKRFFKLLEGGEIEVTGAFPAGIIDTTLANLKAAAAGENYEHTTMYPGFAAIARGRFLAAVSRGSFLGLFAVTRGCLLGFFAVARSRCLLFCLGANCTLGAASAAGGWSGLLLAASAARAHGGAAQAGDQAGYTQPGQYFFQIFLFHETLLL